MIELYKRTFLWNYRIEVLDSLKLVHMLSVKTNQTKQKCQIKNKKFLCRKYEYKTDRYSAWSIDKYSRIVILLLDKLSRILIVKFVVKNNLIFIL